MEALAEIEREERMAALAARFAYADPPYVGQARRMYGTDEVDYVALFVRLGGYDGWALSCTPGSLRTLLALCPPGVRVAAWVKPFAFFHSGTRGRPPYAWEAVIFRTPLTDRRPKGVRDWLSCNAFGVTAAERRRAGNVRGMKPEAFCFWLFALLGLRPGDVFDDLYPGSGAVMAAFEKWLLLDRHADSVRK